MNFHKWKEAIAHAFAVEDGSTELTEADLELLDKVASFVVRRNLVAPVSLFLETLKPLNFVGAQVMTFFRPTLGLFLNQSEYKRLTQILERRCSIELFIQRIALIERSKET